jgi:hypothetical protein
MDSEKPLPRRHDRHELPGKVRLYWRTAEGQSFHLPAKCLDISQSGIRLELERPIEAGTLVQLESPVFRVAGVAMVKRCERVRLRHVVAIEFAGGLTWKQAAD